MPLAVYSQNCFPQLHLSSLRAAATAFGAAFGAKAATPLGQGVASQALPLKEACRG